MILAVLPLLLGACVRLVGAPPEPDASGGREAGGDAAGDGLPAPGDGSSAGDGATDGGPAALTVEPAYAAAPDWMDHVRRSDPAAPHYGQPGEPCRAQDDQAIGACVHAGELRRVRTSLPSCADLLVDDELGAFQWRCDDSGGAAVLYSTGLREEVALGDLLLPTALRENRVRVRSASDGALLAASAPSVWWSNPVAPVPPSAGDQPEVLAGPGTIYVLAADASSSGLHVDDDKVAVVVLPGATLSMTSASGSSCALTTPSGLRHGCLISVGQRAYAWIEGRLRHRDGGGYGVLVVGARHLRLRRVGAASFWHTGVALREVQTARVEDVVAAHNGNQGVTLTACGAVVLTRLTVADSGRVSDAPGDSGLLLQQTEGAVITRVTAVSNDVNGVFFFSGARRNTLGHVTASHNGYAGVAVGAGDNTLFQIVGLRSGTGPGAVFRAPGNLLTQAAFGHQAAALRFTDTGDVEIGGDVLVADNGHTCEDLGAGGPCSRNADRFVQVAGFAQALAGKVTADDGVNTSDAAGAATRAAISDWLGFESRHRAWGAEGVDPFVDPTNAGLCLDGCRIWDWRLGPGADALRARVGGAPALEVVAQGQPCPAAVDGDVAITDRSGNVFLPSALELLDDGLGDDDGLCESGEGCVYRPHLGDAQLGGAVGGARCTFVDGTVRQVRMYGLDGP